MRVAVLADLHLDFVTLQVFAALCAEVRATAPDLTLVLGDTGTASNVEAWLLRLADALGVRVAFVLGNHDYYHGSLAAVQQIAARLSGERRTSYSLEPTPEGGKRLATSTSELVWLDRAEPLRLSATTALLGHGGWADARAGFPRKSTVMLNDYSYIAEFRGLAKAERIALQRRLGDEAAASLAAKAQAALAAGYTELVVATHVPPFRGATWHEGRISDNYFLPHFCNRAAGAALAAVMARHPEATMRVVCGHTHSPGVCQPAANIVVTTYGAEYRAPRLAEVLEFAASGEE